MDARISANDIALLRQAGMTEEDLAHSLVVAERALDIADRTGAALDMNFVVRPQTSCGMGFTSCGPEGDTFSIGSFTFSTAETLLSSRTG